jgi:hypothetical protein
MIEECLIEEITSADEKEARIIDSSEIISYVKSE